MSLYMSICLSVRPSVRMEQSSSHWTDFPEILYLIIIRRSLENIKVALKSDKYNGLFTRKTYALL